MKRENIKAWCQMKCSGCQGSSMKVSIRHLGPSMIQQMKHIYSNRRGTCETINGKNIDFHNVSVKIQIGMGTTIL